MTLKYYLRGLGIGMMVTAIIMGVSLGGQKEAMTDNEIKERARQLGMVESTVLTESAIYQSQKEEKQKEQKVSNEEQKIKETVSNNEQKVEAVPQEEQKTEEAAVVNITIQKGDSSVSVSEKLAKAGLISSVREYDRYLCENAFDKILCVGTYEIKEGTSGEEIAQIITRKK